MKMARRYPTKDRGEPKEYQPNGFYHIHADKTAIAFG